jgi:RimJ/RimL family protein N-acetyltransferase
MQSNLGTLTFRPLAPADLEMLHDWLGRPHVSQWWGPAPSLAEVEEDYLPMIAPESTTRGYIARLEEQPIGFIQSYVVLGSGDGWWEEETDPGARGIDQFLADADQLGRGLGSTMVRTFVEQLFLDPSVTKVQTDPSPENERAIRSYVRAGFQPLAKVDTPDGPALLMVTYHQEPG